MELKQDVRALRAHWVLITVTVVLCTAVAAAYAWTRDPVYAATTQLFVSTNADVSGGAVACRVLRQDHREPARCPGRRR